MRKKIFSKLLFFLLLMVPVCVNAADFLLCGNEKKFPLVFAQVTSVLFVIIKIIVPILLVIMSMISFFKAIISGKVDDELNKAKQVLVHRIIAAVVIFFIVSIVNFAIALVAGRNNSFSSCLNCMIHPDSCEKVDGDLARLCPGLLSDQTDYDENCVYLGSRKGRVDYSYTGDTGVPAYSSNKNGSSNSSSSCGSTKNFEIVEKDGVTYVDGILIVNKSFSLPSSYKPSSAGNTYNCNDCLTEETRSAYNLMKEAASKDNINLFITSGFRSYANQNDLYNNYVSRDGKAVADTYSARPGYSEHQTGLAFDVIKAESSFDNTPEAKWLSQNCYKYGFIIRYPKGKTNVTGYKYESWHVRYVGKDLASKLYNNGDWITLEEYFNLASSYDNVKGRSNYPGSNNSCGDFINWKQCDPKWASVTMGSSSVSLCSAGCTTTSISILMAKSGAVTDMSNFSPVTLAKTLQYDPSNGRISSWDDYNSWKSYAPSFRFVGSYPLNGSISNKANTINGHLNNGEYVMIVVNSGGHYVAADKVEGNTVYIHDPGGAATDLFKTYAASGVNSILVYKREG